MSTAKRLATEGLEFARASRYRTEVLLALHGIGGGLTATDLAGRRDLDERSVWRAVDELTERGLVEPHPDHERGRGCPYVCTDDGATVATFLTERDADA